MTTQIIDTHVHLLDPGRLAYRWLPDGAVLRRASHATHYAADAPAVTGAIVVEAGAAADQSGQEIAWVRGQAAAHPWIRGIVASVSVEHPAGLEAMLVCCRDDAFVVGVRRNLQDDPPGFLRDLTLRNGIRRLGEAGLPFDACVRSWQLTELGELAAACPDTVIVLNHLGKPRCGTDLAQWRTALRALAARPNVRCKLSGLATESVPGSGIGDMLAALRYALTVFGADRCLYGSDWPVSTLAIGNRAWLDLVRTALDGLDASECRQVLVGTAERTYRLPQFPSAAPSSGART